MIPWGMQPVKASLWVCGKFCRSAPGRAPTDQQNQDHLGICEESQAPLDLLNQNPLVRCRNLF